MGFGLDPIGWELDIRIHGLNITFSMTQEEKEEYEKLNSISNKEISDQTKHLKMKLGLQVIERYFKKEFQNAVHVTTSTQNYQKGILRLASDFLDENDHISKLSLMMAFLLERSMNNLNTKSKKDSRNKKLINGRIGGKSRLSIKAAREIEKFVEQWIKTKSKKKSSGKEISRKIMKEIPRDTYKNQLNALSDPYAVVYKKVLAMRKAETTTESKDAQ